MNETLSGPSRIGDDPLQILLLEDNPGDARLVRELLRESERAVDLQWADGLSEGLQVLGPETDVLLVDLGLPDSRGMDTVESVVGAAPRRPVVVLTGQDGHETALAALERGASEYLRKDELTPSLLTRTLHWAVERKQMEQECRKQERRQRVLSQALEQADEPVLITEGTAASDGEQTGRRIVYANAAFEDMTGYDEEDLVGRSPGLLQGPETDEEVLRSRSEALDAGEKWQGETVNYRKDGTPYIAQWNVAPVQGPNGEIEYWVSAQRDVTEDRRREETLRQQQTQRLVGSWSADLRTGAVQWSEEVYRLHEVAPGADVDLQDMLGFYGDEDRSAVRDAFEACVEEGESFELEPLLITPDGARRWVRLVGAPAETEDREVLKIAGAIQDITRRKQAEVDLREERDLLSRILETSPVAIVVLDAEGEFIEASDRAQEIFGLEESEITGLTYKDPVWNIRGPDGGVLPNEEIPFARVMSTGEPVWDVEHTIRWPDGTRRLLSVSGAPLEADDGEIDGAVFHIDDITGRRRAEEALREREARLRGLTNNLPGVVFQWRAQPDGEYTNTFVSDRAEEILGIPADTEGFHERFVARIPQPYREEMMVRADRSVETETPWEFEMPFDKPSGERIWLRGLSTPEQREGEGLMFNGVLLDITEQKEAEASLEKRETQLRGLANSLPGVVYQFYARPDGSYGTYFVGEQSEALLGLASDPDTFFERFVEGVPASHKEAFFASIETVVENKEPWRFEMPFERPDGSRIWLQGRSNPERRGEELIFDGVLLDITARKETEQDLERQNDLFRKAQSLASVGAWEIDLEADEHRWSDEVYRIHDLPVAEEPQVPDAIDFYHPEDRPQIEQAVEKAVESGESYDLELRLVTAEDRERWVRTRGDARVVDGEVVRVRGAIQDITELKRREEVLRDRQEKLEALHAATDRLLRADTRAEVGQFILELINDTLGYRGGTVRFAEEGALQPSCVSEGATELVGGRPALDIDGASTMAEVYRTGESVVVDDVRALDDSVDYGDIRAGAAVPLGRHGVVGIAAAEVGAIDAFDARLVELIATHATAVLDALEQLDALQESEGRFRKIFENAALGIAVVEDGTIVKANPELESMLGYDPGELQGIHFEEITHPEDFDEDMRLFEELMAGEHDQYKLEKRYVRKSGEAFWGALTVSRRDTSEGVRAISMVENIEEQKRYEEGLREAKEEAERMNRLQNAFLANMSHEIRTPLTSILGFAEAIGEHVSDEEEGPVPRFSRLIEKSGRRLMGTLEGMLNLSKLEAGEMAFEVESIDLKAEAAEMIEQFSPQAEASAIDLQGALAPAQAQASEEGVRIVLRNLVSNAIKYTGEGGTVTVRTEHDDEAAHIEVEDTGIGMDPDTVSDLFRAFAQESEGLSREYEGSGLGLTLVKKTVQRMEGEIEVETEKGEGSCFTVRLPRADG